MMNEIPPEKLRRAVLTRGGGTLQGADGPERGRGLGKLKSEAGENDGVGAGRKGIASNGGKERKNQEGTVRAGLLRRGDGTGGKAP